MRFLAASVVLALISFGPRAECAESLWLSAEGVRAVGSDTIVVLMAGEEKTIELFGIEGLAPGQAHAEEARSFLQELVGEKKLTIKEQRVVKSPSTPPPLGPWIWNGRRFVPVGGFLHGMFSRPETPSSKYIVRIGGKSLNQELLLAGLAWSAGPAMDQFSRVAKRKKAGVWADTDPVRPKEWRAKRGER